MFVRFEANFAIYKKINSAYAKAGISRIAARWQEKGFDFDVDQQWVLERKEEDPVGT